MGLTNEQILQKAIKKAVKNGCKLKAGNYSIFNHDFAKAFWGAEWQEGDSISTPMSEILAEENISPWQHHLRQMVLEEEPLKYIKKFL